MVEAGLGDFVGVVLAGEADGVNESVVGESEVEGDFVAEGVSDVDVAGLRYAAAFSSLALELASAASVSFICCFSKYSFALARLSSALFKAASESVFLAAVASVLKAAKRASVCATYAVNRCIFRVAANVLTWFSRFSISVFASLRLFEAASKYCWFRLREALINSALAVPMVSSSLVVL